MLKHNQNSGRDMEIWVRSGLYPLSIVRKFLEVCIKLRNVITICKIISHVSKIIYIKLKFYIKRSSCLILNFFVKCGEQFQFCFLNLPFCSAFTKGWVASVNVSKGLWNHEKVLCWISLNDANLLLVAIHVGVGDREGRR